MKVAYIANGYNNDTIKVECKTDEEFYYWRKVLAKLEDTLGTDVYLTKEEDMESEELEAGDIYKVVR